MVDSEVSFRSYKLWPTAQTLCYTYDLIFWLRICSNIPNCDGDFGSKLEESVLVCFNKVS